MKRHATGFVKPCETCGKRCFETRGDAKKVAKRLKDRGRMHAYKCGTYWHIGHLPARVKAGDKSRDEIEPRRTR